MPGFEVTDIDHVVLRARDAESLARFYVDVLGCPVERRLEIGLTQLRAGGALIDIVAVDSELGRLGGEGPAEDGTGRNLDHFCLRITPFDGEALIEALTAQGVECTEIREVYGAQGMGRSVYIKDPEGNVVELKEARTGG